LPQQLPYLPPPPPPPTSAKIPENKKFPSSAALAQVHAVQLCTPTPPQTPLLLLPISTADRLPSQSLTPAPPAVAAVAGKEREMGKEKEKEGRLRRNLNPILPPPPPPPLTPRSFPRQRYKLWRHTTAATKAKRRQEVRGTAALLLQSAAVVAVVHDKDKDEHTLTIMMTMRLQGVLLIVLSTKKLRAYSM